MRTARFVLLFGSLMFVMAATARAGDSQADKGSASSDNVVTKMTTGTRRLVSSTKSMLMPKKQTTVRKRGTTAIHKKNADQKKPGFFQSLFQPEPPPPRTIKEWMALKQVTP